MKAWMSLGKTDLAFGRKKLQPDSLLGCLLKSFERDRGFWTALGKVRPRVCQFHIAGAELETWFVLLDPVGPMIIEGEHTKADAVWRSSGETLVAVMERRLDVNEALQSKAIQLSGNLDLLQEMMDAVAKGLRRAA